jgi:hypothetical protein
MAAALDSLMTYFISYLHHSVLSIGAAASTADLTIVSEVRGGWFCAVIGLDGTKEAFFPEIRLIKSLIISMPDIMKIYISRDKPPKQFVNSDIG